MQPKWSGLQDLQTWRGRKTIQGKNLIQCTGRDNITIAPSTEVVIGRSTNIVLQILFVVHFFYFPKNFPSHWSQPKKGNCMVSWLNTASPSWCHRGIPWNLKQMSPMYHSFVEGGTGYFKGGLHLFCPFWILFMNDYTGLGRRGGGAALKFSCATLLLAENCMVNNSTLVGC